MIEANKFKLGLFVIIAFALFLAAIFAFGLGKFFKKDLEVFSVFSDSVQGLSVGSPVKFKGVPVGSVKKIKIRGEDELIVVFMELDTSVFSLTDEFSGNFRGEAFERFYHEQMKRGITCGLELAGITGMKFVELDYRKDSDSFTPLPQPKGIGGYYIPSRPSVFQNIISMITKSLNNLASIKSDEIVTELTGVLKNANRLLGDPRIPDTIDQFREASHNINRSAKTLGESFSKERLDELLAMVKTDLNNFNELITTLQKEVQDSKISQTTAAFRNSAQSISEGKIAILATLQRLDQALDAITEFVNYIDDDPSALLKGKQKPKITDGEDKILPRYLRRIEQDNPSTTQE